MKGIFGLTKKRYITERYKYDALEFYDEGINWFAFSFVMLGLDAHLLRFLLEAHSNEVKLVDESGMQINDQTYGKQEIYFMISLVVARVITVLIFSRMRDDDF